MPRSGAALRVGDVHETTDAAAIARLTEMSNVERIWSIGFRAMKCAGHRRRSRRVRSQISAATMAIAMATASTGRSNEPPSPDQAIQGGVYALHCPMIRTRLTAKPDVHQEDEAHENRED